jgi:hypothetical protein
MSPISSTLAGASTRGYGGLGASVTTPIVGDYQSIASYSLTSAGTVTFADIPQDFTHLQIRAYGRNASTSNTINMHYNSDTTASNYYARGTFGGGSASGWSQNQAWANYWIETNSTGNYMATMVIDIFDYKNTSKAKIAQTLGGFALNSDGYAWFQTTTWNNTAAITNIALSAVGTSVNFEQYTRFALYGIK